MDECFENILEYYQEWKTSWHYEAIGFFGKQVVGKPETVGRFSILPKLPRPFACFDISSVAEMETEDIRWLVTVLARVPSHEQEILIAIRYTGSTFIQKRREIYFKNINEALPEYYCDWRLRSITAMSIDLDITRTKQQEICHEVPEINRVALLTFSRMNITDL